MLLIVSLIATACGAGSATKGSTTQDINTDPATEPEESYRVERESVRGQEVIFIKQRPEPPGSLSASAMGGGELVVDEEGCFRMISPGNEPGDMLIWPSDLEFSTDGSEVSILDDQGLVVARVGDKILVGGASTGDERSVPEECRRGPYWEVGINVCVVQKYPSGPSQIPRDACTPVE